MVPPFKFFIYFRDRIAGKASELQLQMHETGDQESAKLPNLPAASSEVTVQQELSSTTVPDFQPNVTESSSKDETTITEPARSMLSYLKTVLDFIDTNCSHSFTLQTCIRLGSLEKIAFDDLWHLFKPGDLLFSTREGKEQLYRTHYVTGGRLRLRNKTKDELERSGIRRLRRDMDLSGDDDEVTKREYIEAFGRGTYSPLTIDCYSIAFNGKDLGPLDTAVQVSRYNGDRDVSSLPIYPVRFHKDGEEAVRRRLRECGEKYLSCYGYKTYDGQATIWRICGKKDYSEEF
ncbi:hypothetical protein F5B21DRAFT_425310 [Xylaria acuta]|nr:hypothetical protein F5B21DRAFT_425310 [Xylaria acuta]